MGQKWGEEMVLERKGAVEQDEDEEEYAKVMKAVVVVVGKE